MATFLLTIPDMNRFVAVLQFLSTQDLKLESTTSCSAAEQVPDQNYELIHDLAIEAAKHQAVSRELLTLIDLGMIADQVADDRSNRLPLRYHVDDVKHLIQRAREESIQTDAAAELENVLT